ncbi:hypothetical protein KUTeg_010717 [Tegillarca granosa]|uniref:Uncharacterized protein n=1 Tax=Tegillarca granosa TaxID=220873 RepID=A0ABQ9F1U1_TEGGR|nr:hypothetical protein KUTeg_010717 [Tegillarca granosa]
MMGTPECLENSKKYVEGEVTHLGIGNFAMESWLRYPMPRSQEELDARIIEAIIEAKKGGDPEEVTDSQSPGCVIV